MTSHGLIGMKASQRSGGALLPIRKFQVLPQVSIGPVCMGGFIHYACGLQKFFWKGTALATRGVRIET